MVAATDKVLANSVETERLVDNFKQQLLLSLEKDRARLREIAEQESKQILAKAYQDASGLTQKAQEKGLQIVQAATAQAKSEVENILAQGRAQAEQLVKNGEEMARRDAKEKTRREIEKLMASAKEDAAKQGSATLQAAREEAGEIIAKSKKEATEISRQIMDEAEVQLKGILENARKEAKAKAEKEAAEITEKARAQAEKEKELLILAANDEARSAAQKETERIIAKANAEADTILNGAKNKVRLQMEESGRLMQEMQQRMQQVMAAAGFESKHIEFPAIHAVPPEASPAPPPPIPVKAPVRQEETAERVVPVDPPRKVERSSTSSEMAQAKLDSIFANDETRNYQGRLKIDIAPPVDSEQISNLEQNLSKNTNLRVLGNGGSEDGSAWVEVDILKPMPLVSALRKIPGVKDVVGAKSYIIVALKAKQHV